jgi:hypothetical protein
MELHFMPADTNQRGDDVEKLLAEEKAIADRHKALIEDLLKAKAAAVKEFDDKLAKLGYTGDGPRKRGRSHHRKTAPAEKAKS